MTRLEALTGSHDRNNFDCGVAALDRWLREQAGQHERRGLARTLVLVPAGLVEVESFCRVGYADVTQHTVLGFYALSSAQVVRRELPPAAARRLPEQIPVTRLGRLAIRQDLHGQGLGRILLADAVLRAHRAAQTVASAGLFVDAKNPGAVAFYRQYGFMPCADDPQKLFLPMPLKL